jgi:hypothetical protein
MDVDPLRMTLDFVQNTSPLVSVPTTALTTSAMVILATLCRPVYQTVISWFPDVTMPIFDVLVKFREDFPTEFDAYLAALELVREQIRDQIMGDSQQESRQRNDERLKTLTLVMNRFQQALAEGPLPSQNLAPNIPVWTDLLLRLCEVHYEVQHELELDKQKLDTKKDFISDNSAKGKNIESEKPFVHV